MLSESEILPRRTLLSRYYYEFMRFAFMEQLPNEDFQENWHYEYVCSRIQYHALRAVNNLPNEIDLLILNVPPRSLKTWMVARALTAWLWIDHPWTRVLGSAYAADMARNHALDNRDIIASEWYQQLFGHKFKLKEDSNAKARFDNDKGGFRMAVGVGGAATGEGGHIIFTDDPQNPKQADSAAERLKANQWFTKTFWSRLNNDSTGLRIIVQQRLHTKDLTGFMLDKVKADKDDGLRVEHISLPATLNDMVQPKELVKEYEERDGLLFPARLTKQRLRRSAKALGPYGYAGQYQQRPSPEGGGKIKRHWFPIIHRHELPTDLKKWTYTDPSEGKVTSDEMASICWSIHEGKMIVWEVMSKVEPFDKFVGSINLEGKWEDRTYDHFLRRNNCYNIETLNFWEAKSLGQSYVDHINARAPYKAVADNPGRESKEQRVLKYIPVYWSGSVVLVAGPWVEGFLNQLEMYPNTDEDGQVDVLASAIRLSDLSIPDEEEMEDDDDEGITEDDLFEDLGEEERKQIDMGLI